MAHEKFNLDAVGTIAKEVALSADGEWDEIIAIFEKEEGEILAFKASAHLNYNGQMRFINVPDKAILSISKLYREMAPKAGWRKAKLRIYKEEGRPKFGMEFGY